MSRWLPSPMLVAFGPQRVALLHPAWRLGRRGPVREFRLMACAEPPPAAGCASWEPALQALATTLPGAARPVRSATVVVSSHFVRYTLVDMPAGLSHDEQDAFARHAFERIHGRAADGWTLRRDGRLDGPHLACAMESAFLEGLRQTFAAAAIRLRSVQPHLMAALDGARGFWRQPDAWAALAEPGHLCLLLRHHDRWARVRGLRVDDEQAAWLPLLEREALLAGVDDVPREVHAMGLPGDAAAPAEPWCLHALPSTAAVAALAR